MENPAAILDDLGKGGSKIANGGPKSSIFFGNHHDFFNGNLWTKLCLMMVEAVGSRFPQFQAVSFGAVDFGPTIFQNASLFIKDIG